MTLKLKLAMSVSVDGCLSLCGPVMDWRPVQGVPCILPNESWDGSLDYHSFVLRQSLFIRVTPYDVQPN